VLQPPRGKQIELFFNGDTPQRVRGQIGTWMGDGKPVSKKEGVPSYFVHGVKNIVEPRGEDYANRQRKIIERPNA